MKAVETAHILAIGSSLPAKARGIAAQLHGQFLGAQQVSAEEVGQRNLCRWNQIKVIVCTVVHLSFFVRQLTGAPRGVGIDKVGRDELFVACLIGAVQKKLDEGTLELRAFTAVNRKSSTGDFDAGFKVNQLVPVCQFPMRHSSVSKLGPGAFFGDHLVVGIALTSGHTIVRAVGQFEQG